MRKNCYEHFRFHPKELPVNETVRRFLPMVDFLEQILGKNSEIVPHDFSIPTTPSSIFATALSGRGRRPIYRSGAQDHARPRVATYPFITGYEGRGAGGKTLESATFFIREDDEIVGMLCVNTDLSTVRSINAMAQQLMACFDAAPTRTEPAPIEVESLSESTQELIDRSIAELLSARELDVAIALVRSDPRGRHSPPQRQRGCSPSRAGLRCHRVGHLGAQRVPLPAKSPQGGLTSKMERGSTSDSSLDKRPCSSHVNCFPFRTRNGRLSLCALI